MINVFQVPVATGVCVPVHASCYDTSAEFFSSLLSENVNELALPPAVN